MKPASSDMTLVQPQGSAAVDAGASAGTLGAPIAAAMAASTAASAASESVTCACCRAAACCRLASAAHSRAAFQAISSIVCGGGRASPGPEELFYRLLEGH